jgi:hypothetical protein
MEVDVIRRHRAAGLAWALASPGGLMIVSKASYSGTYAETRGMQEMAVRVETI